MMLYQPK